MSTASPQVPPGSPSMISAIRRTVSLAAGIHVGFGVPWPWRETSRPKRRRTVIELSSDCMTSAITVRSDQCRLSSERANVRGCRTIAPSSRSARGTRPPPSVISVVSRPMALLP